MDGKTEGWGKWAPGGWEDGVTGGLQRMTREMYIRKEKRRRDFNCHIHLGVFLVFCRCRSHGSYIANTGNLGRYFKLLYQTQCQGTTLSMTVVIPSGR